MAYARLPARNPLPSYRCLFRRVLSNPVENRAISQPIERRRRQDRRGRARAQRAFGSAERLSRGLDGCRLFASTGLFERWVGGSTAQFVTTYPTRRPAAVYWLGKLFATVLASEKQR